MNIRWTKAWQNSIRLRISRGESPGEIKAAFARLVDRISDKDMPATLSDAVEEIKRLQRSIRSLKGVNTRQTSKDKGSSEIPGGST